MAYSAKTPYARLDADLPRVHGTLLGLMGTLLFALINFLRAAFGSRSSLALENAALRQQLAAYQRTHRRPRLRARDRLFWVFLRKAWAGWSRPLIIVKPDTVIGWHRQGFRLLWQRKSRSAKLGRRRIPREHINFIRRSSRDHPEWGEDKIAEEFAAKFGIQHSPSDHGRQTMRLRGRVVLRFSTTADGEIPRGRRYRCHVDRWLQEVIGVQGLPTPYGAPNALPHIERFMRMLRREALDHFIFLGADHVRRVVTEYFCYYNRARPSQAIHGIPDPYPELREPPPRAGRLTTLPVLGGIQHDYRLAA